jgi:hypothetical protein
MVVAECLVALSLEAVAYWKVVELVEVVEDAYQEWVVVGEPYPALLQEVEGGLMLEAGVMVQGEGHQQTADGDDQLGTKDSVQLEVSQLQNHGVHLWHPS